MHTRTRVLCVDDGPEIGVCVRHLCAADPTIEWVGYLPSADGVEAEVRRLQPHVVLMDLRMPGADPLQAIQQLAESHPDVRTIVYSGYPDPNAIDQAFDAGAWGWVCKDEDLGNLVRAIRKVVAGEVVHPRFGRRGHG